jgi:hypothetical protein
MTTLKEVDFSKKVFECDGIKWYVEDSISFARYMALEEIALEFGFSATFADLFKNLRKMWDLHNQLKFAETAVIMHNMMRGIVSLEDKKQDASLRICALFINSEDEDRAEYNEAKMLDKISRWGKECNVRPFFHLAASVVNGWLPAYKLTLNSSFLTEEKPKTDTSKVN